MDQQPQTTFGSGQPSGKRWLKWGIIAVIVLIALGAAAAAYMVLTKDKAGDEVVTKRPKVCSEEINQKANTYMNGGGGPLDYRQLTSEIKAKDGYDKDPNCLYALLNYNLLRNISTDSDTYLSKLETIFKQDATLSSAYTPRIGLDTLKKRVAALKSANAAQDKANAQADQDSLEAERYVNETPAP